MQDEEMKDKLERADAILERDMKRWALRRKIVTIAFGVLIVLIGFLIMVAPAVFDTEQVEALNSMSELTTFILGCLTSLVLGYFGMAAVDDWKSKAMEGIKNVLK